MFCLTGQREEQIRWIPEKEQSLFDTNGMAYNLPKVCAKIPSVSCKNLGDKFTKITIAVICAFLLIEDGSATEYCQQAEASAAQHFVILLVMFL